jgi:arylsulfatase A-like enzyme
LVHHADLIATIAEILGAQLPDDAGEDSFSLLPILKGSDRPVRQHAVSTACNGLPSFRAGHWKYVANAEPELYKLDEDIAESQNVAARHPEQLQSMRESFEKLIRAGRSTPGVPQKNDIKVIRYPKVAGE